MTVSLSTLPPPAASTSSARDARAAAPVARQPSAPSTSANAPAGAGHFERTLQAVQWRDEVAPSPALPTTTSVAVPPTDAQSSADEARAAVAAALLTPIAPAQISAPTGQTSNIHVTDLDKEDAGVEPALTSMPAPGLQLNATLLDNAQRAALTRPLSDAAASGALLEPAAGWAHPGDPARKPALERDAIFIGTVGDRHTEVDAPAPATGHPASWRDALSAELNTTGASTSTLKLPASSPSQWREPLLNTLGERVQWHTQRGSEQAVIRLDPPSLGRLDIVIKQEGGLMHVHMSATNREVVQQLQGLSDQLRQDLAGRHSGDVAVLVSEQSRDGDSRQRGRQGNPDDQQGRPGRALSDADDTQPSLRAFSLQTPER